MTHTYKTQHRLSKSWSSCVTAQQLIEALIHNGFEFVPEDRNNRPSSAFRKRAKKAYSALSSFLDQGDSARMPKLSQRCLSVYMRKADPEKEKEAEEMGTSPSLKFNRSTKRFGWAQPDTFNQVSNPQRRARKDETKKTIVVPVSGMVSDSLLREARKVAGVPSEDEFRLKLAA